MGKKGKQQSRKSKKKELNKTLSEASKTKDPLEMTAAELANSPEFQRLKRKYEKKQTLQEFKQWYRRHYRILESMVSTDPNETWEDLLDWFQDPDFQFEMTWEEWVGKGSKEEEDDDDDREEEIEELIQGAQYMWSNFLHTFPQNLSARLTFPQYQYMGWGYQ